MVTEPKHIDGTVLDLVLTDVPDVVEVRFDSSVGPSDHSAISVDVVLEKPISHSVHSRRSITKTLWTGSWLEEI